MKTFILVEPDPIVGMDVSGMIASTFADHTLTHVENLSEAEKPLQMAGVETTILAKASIVDPDNADFALLRDAVTRGARLVWLGEAPAVDIPAGVIDLPFTNETVLAVLGHDMPELQTPDQP